MKILVISTDYPDNGDNVACMFVHVRNLYYIKRGQNVSVVNFSLKGETEYIKDGIRVISVSRFKKECKEYDILVSHAPNLRKHYPFIKKYGKKFSKIYLFFHGHEIVRLASIYSQPFSFVRKNQIVEFFQAIYDNFKLLIWKRYIKKNIDKLHMVFVSKWFYETALSDLNIKKETIKNKYSIIYNPIDIIFIENSYDFECIKEYDFITIRSNLDNSKYGVDIVNRIAKNFPEYKFLVIGKGTYFDHNEKSNNLEWQNRTLSHEEMLRILNKSKFALMPTRTDAQGVMACEMASYGIPLITSDIEICKEIFESFDNVYFINNNFPFNDLKKIISDFKDSKSTDFQKNSEYFYENTTEKELELFQKSIK